MQMVQAYPPKHGRIFYKTNKNDSPTLSIWEECRSTCAINYVLYASNVLFPRATLNSHGEINECWPFTMRDAWKRFHDFHSNRFPHVAPHIIPVFFRLSRADDKLICKSGSFNL